MKKVKVAAAVLVLAAAGGAAWLRPWAAGPAELRLPGTVETQEVRLGSRVGGRVAAVLVRDGEAVEPGRELVRFEADELVARRDQARHRLEAAQAAWQKADRGPLPEEIAEAKGEADAARARLARTTAGFRDEQKRQARGELDAERAALRKAEDGFGRYDNLAAVSDQDREAARSARDRARGRVAASEATLDLLTRGSRAEDIAEATAEYERYAARHALLRRGTRAEDKAASYAAVGQAAAQLAEAETAVREAVVVALERCLVELVSVRPGDVVPAGQPVVRALRADDLWVKAFVPATDLGHLRVGRAVAVAVDSHPGRRLAGTVAHVAGASEFTPRNVQSVDERRHQVFAVRVRVADPDGVVKSGMAAEVFVPLAGGN